MFCTFSLRLLRFWNLSPRIGGEHCARSQFRSIVPVLFVQALFLFQLVVEIFPTWFRQSPSSYMAGWFLLN